MIRCTGTSGRQPQVRWRTYPADGHIISGVFAIGVDVDRQGHRRRPPELANSPAYLRARVAYFSGLMLLLAGCVRLAVWLPVRPGCRPAARDGGLRERHRATQLGALAAVLLLGGGWVALTRQGAEVAGVSFWQAFNHNGPVGSALQATRFGREFGRGIDLAAVFVILAASAFWLARRSRPRALALAVPATALGVWAVVVPGLSGHAGDPGLGTLAVIVDAVHVAAAAIWIGGLARLVWVMPHATRGLAGEQQSAARLSATRRFSTLALASVIVVAATGGARALWEVSAVSQLWTTGYGRTLIVKTVLLAGLIALGYRNRSALERFAEIRRRGVVGLGLMAGLLAAVSVLTNLQPANAPSLASAESSSPQGGTQAVQDRAGRLVLAVWPGTAGPNWFATRTSPGSALPVVTVQPASSGGDSRSANAPRRRRRGRARPAACARHLHHLGRTRREHPLRRRPSRSGPPAASRHRRRSRTAPARWGRRGGRRPCGRDAAGRPGHRRRDADRPVRVEAVPDALVTFAGRTALPCRNGARLLPGARARIGGDCGGTGAASVPAGGGGADRAPGGGCAVCGRVGAEGRSGVTARSRACDPRTCSRPTHNTRCTPRFSRTPPTSSRSTSTAASGRSSIGDARYDRNAAGRWTTPPPPVPARYPGSVLGGRRHRRPHRRPRRPDARARRWWCRATRPSSGSGSTRAPISSTGCA